MATVVPCASCYGSGQPLYLFGRAPRGTNYLSLFSYRGPRCTPRPRLAYPPPKMTLRQICGMLKVMKQETRIDLSDPGVAWHQVGQEVPPGGPRHKRSIKRVG